MSVRSIEAEVYIQSGVEAEVQIGREIVKTVYEEPVLESLEVVSNGTYEPEEGIDGYSDVTVNVPIPESDPNIIKGEFQGDEDGVLRVNIPYYGDAFPKMITIYVKGDIDDINGAFLKNANLNAINVAQILKMNVGIPTFDSNSNSNFARFILLYKSSNTGYGQSASSGYAYQQDACRWTGNCLKIRDNKTMDVFIQTERDPVNGGIFFMRGVRYTYQVFY